MRVTFSDDQFARLRTLLGAAAGLVFDDSRRDSVAYSVGERMRLCGAPTVEAYLTRLGTGGVSAELQELLDEVTIQETHFFRNPPQIRALRQHVLPELVRAAAARGDRRLRIWSAGSSTGEEPYTVAMLLRELLPSTEGWDVKVLGTDIAARALETARGATYGLRAMQMAEQHDVDRWFVKEGRRGEEVFRVRDEVRELVELRHHNLVTEPVPFEPGSVDLVLCRNVTIYFGRETTRDLVSRLHATLRDGGYLFLGHSETLWQVSDHFRLVTLGDAFVYRRADPGDGERRHVLPDRRTEDEGIAPPLAERRTGLRRSDVAWAVLTKPRQLPLRRSPARDARPGLVAVRGALAAAEYAEAARLAGEMAECDPLQAEAHYLRGLALSNLGDDEGALVSLRKAVYLDPSSGFAHFLLAGALARVGERSAAVASYRAAARSLDGVPSEVVAAELGGRSIAELVEMCDLLADKCEEEVSS